MTKRIMRLAVPNIVSNITVPILSLVDIAVLGYLDTEVYIGAIALGGTIFNFIYWGFAFLRMSTSGFTAQNYGRKHYREAANVLLRAMSVATLGALLIILLQKPVADISFLLIEGTEEVEKYAREYFYIRLWAAPASLSLIVLNGWFIGMQNSRIPMIISIVINIINISLNFVFVFIFGLKSDGVAWSTVCAQYCGFALALFFLNKYYKVLFKRISWDNVLVRSKLRRFFSVNSHIFIRMLGIIFVFSFFNIQSAKMGNLLLAVNSLLLQFLMLFSYLADGFAYAAEALTGKYVGQRKILMLDKMVKHIFMWGIIIGTVFTVLYASGGDILLGLLTDNETVLKEAKNYLLWVTAIPFMSFATFAWDGVYIGATASVYMRNAVIFSVIFVFIPVFYLAEKSMANHALWFAMILFMLSRGIFQTIFYKKAVLSKIRDFK